MKLSKAFQDPFRPLAVMIGFVAYVALGVSAFVVVFQMWMPAGVPKTEVVRLAEADPTLALAQSIISTSLAIAAGYIACQLSGSRGLKNSLLTGLPLMFYAALNIHLHSNDAYLTHFMQFVWACLLPVFGGTIRWRWVLSKTLRTYGRA